jgi:hypothetical protein
MRAQTCAAGFDFQEEGDQDSISSLVAEASNELFYTIRGLAVSSRNAAPQWLSTYLSRTWCDLRANDSGSGIIRVLAVIAVFCRKNQMPLRKGWSSMILRIADFLARSGVPATRRIS